jgi:hypothetical protein
MSQDRRLLKSQLHWLVAAGGFFLSSFLSPSLRADDARVIIAPISDDLWRYMQGRSWRPDLPCPARGELALLRIPYFDFEGTPQLGAMIVAKIVAPKVAAAFQEIYASKKFRIHRMSLIDEFQGDDDRSMAANNTSAFNCRTTDRGVMSRHAFGMAVDINPVQNPYREGGVTSPVAGRAYDDPSRRRGGVVGLIVDGDVVTRAFARQGWSWGGRWKRSVDYQHFSNDGH